MVLKVFPQDFLTVLAAPLPRIPIRSFWQWCDQMGEIREFWPGESILLQNFTPVVPKVCLQNFLPILATPWPKITNWSFWPSCDQMMLLTIVRPKLAFGPFEVRPWVKFSKFWSGETSDLYANDPESFIPGFFTHFGRPTAENYESVFLTVVWPNVGFDLRPKSMLGLFDRCATRKGLKNPRLMVG